MRKTAIASGKPHFIDANISVELNPGGAGVWELPARQRPAGDRRKIRAGRLALINS
jgi:hypothetical protein